jgi:hypothetical protein
MRWVNAIECYAAEHASSAKVGWSLQAIQGKHGSIKEYSVVVAIPVCWVDIVKALRELNKGSVITFPLIKHEADCCTESLRIVDVVVAVKVDDELCIGE